MIGGLIVFWVLTALVLVSLELVLAGALVGANALGLLFLALLARA